MKVWTGIALLIVIGSSLGSLRAQTLEELKMMFDANRAFALREASSTVTRRPSIAVLWKILRIAPRPREKI